MKNRSYLDDFRSKYKFLEEYGFVLANDSCNPERLCYKNKFGEIVLWTKNEKGAFCSPAFYVQINGWKTEIDVVLEYKKCIGKITLFKSIFQDTSMWLRNWIFGNFRPFTKLFIT
jgi:hypothetical protein